MSVDLDSQEVLRHLNDLGYCNISKGQLKEFVQDLKKLISNDAKNLEDRLSMNEIGSVFMKSNETVASQKSSACDTALSSYVACERSTFNSENCTSMDTTNFTTSVSSTSQDLDSLLLLRSKSYPESIASTRCKSAFIRPWRLNPEAQKTHRGCASDPVALYHNYQRQWKQQKLPGEDNRSDLRWSVRERMMGQNVYPAPKPLLTRATSVDQMQKRIKQLRK